jgi:hypothetical protein
LPLAVLHASCRAFPQGVQPARALSRPAFGLSKRPYQGKPHFLIATLLSP